MRTDTGLIALTRRNKKQCKKVFSCRNATANMQAVESR
jgi:hypothetical protein